MCFRSQTRRHSRQHEDGYILLTLLLIIALMIIGTAAIVPSITFEIRRDREEEMIHRGVQYSRAIRAYYKKFGRYPTKLEDLESASNMRFLRKRYKDPITGKDFKLLHFGEVKLTFSGGIGGGSIPGANPIGGQGLNGPGAPGQVSTFGGNSAFGQNSTPGGSFGANANSSFGTNADGVNANAISNDTGQSDSSTQVTPIPGQKEQPDQLSTQVFGGGPIVGVASSSKKETIREFNHKKKYNEWQFIYDPATDRGGLLMTPNQPGLQGFGQGGQNLNGQNVNGQNVNGQNNGAFGNGTGVQPGMPNNPSSPGTVAPGTTTDPNNPPQQ